MTFDLTTEQQCLSDRARAVAEGAIASSTSIDGDGRIPDALRQALAEPALADPFGGGEVNAMVVIEELAAASAGFGAAVGFGSAAGTAKAADAAMLSLPGLRGSEREAAAIRGGSAGVLARARLVCCAVALGVGRAAVTHATTSMKAAGIRPSGGEVVPHWALADAATAVEAARLLTIQAAQILERGGAADRAIAQAKSLSAAAAEQAVAAAIRVEGPKGFERGGLLDRLTRDAHTLTVILS